MEQFQLKTPVAFMVFNRPDTTEKVFEAIRKVKPAKLLVVADGPRPDKLGESEKCAAVRAIIDRVDWDCEILKNYSEVNLGCKHRIASGLDWVFDRVEEAIILEDDCLPHPTFFRFCEELLVKYRNDRRIMTICGSNVLTEWKSNIQSYHFSIYFNCWGWATWKRAWKYYDVDMKLWSETEIKQRVRDALADRNQYLYRQKVLDKTYFGNCDTWDRQWTFSCLAHSGLSVIPSVNLISNIGFTQDSTHTSNSRDERANLPLHSMVFPMKEPLGLAVDREYSYRFYKKLWESNLLKRAINKVKRALSEI